MKQPITTQTKSCTICDREDFDPPSPGHLVVAQKWSNSHERWIIFKGYVCERHAAELRNVRWM